MKLSVDADPAEYLELVEKLRSHRENIVGQITGLQQLVDFIDIKLEEGRPSQEYTDLSPDDVWEESKGKANIKPISFVEMSYFPPSAKSGKLPNSIK